ncbi:AAA family ATPase (plasmid) [Roseomonas gilardii]|uniref:AAA family ATPase n=1 Tax=Roseomonas gilardii TaxID=257708 RepID=A0A1L7ANR7_9PROT|nr:ATP-binding protein [Roseomonas gilardii]APT60425.1 AAA family ATPase [Roseomonas gilardii]
MDHFSIVQALCRTALASTPEVSPALRKQVERLRDALKAEGDEKQASSLAAMLALAARQHEITPSRITQSRAVVSGEQLTATSPLPVDRETSAPLVEIIMPGQLRAERPIFNQTVEGAVATITDEWRNMEALSAVGEEPARTCLIYGAPGTGKTHLALWLASQLELPVVLARIDGLVSSFLGTTARNLGSLFAFANRYRCLLMLDEFDAVAKLRDDPQEVGEIKRVVNALLQNLDGRREVGLTIGITNHPKLLDPAVWRRFEVQLQIPLPDFNVRVEIARRFMQPVTTPDSHLRLIAWFAEGASGAEIEAIVRTYKKARAVQGSGEQVGMLETLRRFAALNSGRVQAERLTLLSEDGRKLVEVLHNDKELRFSYSDIGEILGRDKSTVSRLLGGTTGRKKREIADG